MTSSIEAVRAALAKYDAVLKSPTSTANDCVAAMKRFEKSILPMDVEYVLATLDAAIRERDELRGDAARQAQRIDALLAHCPDAECAACAKIICPSECAFHFHHDGCPACEQDSARSTAGDGSLG